MSFVDVSARGGAAASAAGLPHHQYSGAHSAPFQSHGAATTPPGGPPANSDLRGTLRALHANNAVLRRLAADLRASATAAGSGGGGSGITTNSARVAPLLRRVRDMRAQNRELAHAASVMAARLPPPPPPPASPSSPSSQHRQATAHARANDRHANNNASQHALPDVDTDAETAQQLRKELADTITEFCDALRESVQAEAITVAATSAATKAPVGGAREQRLHAASEQTPLLNEERAAASVVSDEVEAVHAAETVSAGRAADWRELQAIEALRSEREHAIRDVQASIQDVNSIFKDIAVMVGEQAVHVDYVEVQMGDAKEAIRAARRQLEITQRRRERRKSIFFRALFLVAVIVAVILIVLLS